MVSSATATAHSENLSKPTNDQMLFTNDVRRIKNQKMVLITLSTPEISSITSASVGSRFFL